MPDPTPLVSIVIPTYNYGRYVTQAIDSALSQTYPHIEVIVLDDGSTDDTKARLKPYEGRISYVYQENRGLSAARNAAIRLSRGDLVAFLDSDDIWLDDKLACQVAVLTANPGVGLVSCAFIEFDDRVGVKRTFVYPHHPDRAALRRELLFANVVSGGSGAVVRRALLERAGLFDERLRGAEDWDMWLRLSLLTDFRVLPQPLVKVRTGFDSLSSAGNAAKMLENELKVYRKQVALDPVFRRSLVLRSRVLAFRFNRAAWAHMASGNRGQALLCLVRSLVRNPFLYLEPGNFKLLVRIATFGAAYRVYKVFARSV